MKYHIELRMTKVIEQNYVQVLTLVDAEFLSLYYVSREGIATWFLDLGLGVPTQRFFMTTHEMLRTARNIGQRLANESELEFRDLTTTNRKRYVLLIEFENSTDWVSIHDSLFRLEEIVIKVMKNQFSDELREWLGGYFDDLNYSRILELEKSEFNDPSATGFAIQVAEVGLSFDTPGEWLK